VSIFRRIRRNGPEGRTLRDDTRKPIDIDGAWDPYAPAKRPTAGPSIPSGASTASEERHFAPHCDARILHKPGECWACDLYPDWQALRMKWGIAFTGHEPKIHRLIVDWQKEPVSVRRELPCPADYNRPPDSPSDHRQWGPNQAQGADRG
jgi:hypothetical protein